MGLGIFKDSKGERERERERESSFFLLGYYLGSNFGLYSK